jgi:Protein of unknown function (DUF3467)
MTEGERPKEPSIFIEPGQMAGAWANFARVSHSPYEFTLDFVRLDYSVIPPQQGIVVARVSLSPLLVTQLIDALNENWQIYAERTLPQEVQGDVQSADHEDDSGPRDAPA